MARNPCLLAALTLAWACGGDKGGAGGSAGPDLAGDTVDADRDGFPSDVDCDDDDASIHPGAGELCDGVDEDCDGEVDEDAVNAKDWYVDADEDGFGAEDGFVERGCEQPAGAVDDGTDCDDGEPAVNPGADEICNDIDDNCDGVVDSDAVDLVEWYVDGDGDGWGTGAPSTPQCGPIAGYADQDGDCDDDDPDINPDAVEVVGDRIDNNCDGKSNGIWGEIDLGTVDCRWYADDLGDKVGSSVSGAGDWNGDGYDDFVVAAYNSDRSLPSAGAVGVMLGPCEGTEVWSDAAWAIYEGMTAGGRAGNDVSGLGDIDGDGYDDIGIGAYKDSTVASTSGAAFVVLGGEKGVSSLKDAHAAWFGEGGGNLAGSRIVGGGDLTGDGQADVVIDAQRWSEPDDINPWRGAAYVVSGSVTGPHSLTEATAAVRGEAEILPDGYDYLGISLAVTDADGDGAADLYVGALGGGIRDQGEVYLFVGPVSGEYSRDDADATWYGQDKGSFAGVSVADGDDLNGDGYPDLAVGARYQQVDSSVPIDSGVAYVLFGPNTSSGDLADAGYKLGGVAGQCLGDPVAAAGDLDGDGHPDLAIGGPSFTGSCTGCPDNGYVFVVYGPLTAGTWLSPDADAILSGEASDDSAGEKLSGAGDTDGDGYDDLLVGAKGHQSPVTAGGAAYLLPGGDG